MALINCPECNHEISDTINTCPHCGYELIKSKKIVCPECNQETTMDKASCPTCGYVFQVTKTKGTEKIISSILLLPKYAFFIGLIISVVLFFVGITRIKNDNYEFYSKHMQECIDLQDEARQEAYTASYYLSSTYEMIVDNYDDLIETDKKTLNIYRAQAIVLCALGIFVGASSLYFLKKGGNANGAH